ncbi:MAG: cytochrome c oxidase subunit II [Pseudomonadota bacterium]
MALADYQLNFQEPVTEVARDIYGLHMLIFWICVGIFVAVFGVMFYSIFKHRKSKNYKPAQFSHSTSVEIVWTVIPFLILVVMAIPATQVLIKMEDTTKSDLTIKITGYQWKWGYEYLDGSNISFFSTLATPRNQIDQFAEGAVPPGENYLLETDNHVVVPSGRKVRALITANDVIHAWWIPAFGTKKDAIPGYINELWFNVDEGKEGIYRGQCAELCGKDHAFMPIVVRVVTGAEFDAWTAAGGKFPDTDGLVEQDQSPLIERSVETATAENTVETSTGA